MNCRQSLSVALASLKCGVALSTLVFSAAAFALAPEPEAGAEDNEDNEDNEEIVIIGSSIRSEILPAGAGIINVGAQDITESGADSGNDILQNVPQITNFFNAAPDVGGNNPFGINAAPIARPNLRSLPGINVNSSALTLILMNGHRLTPSGLTQQIAVDADVVPPSLLAGVEIMPDGASSIYGADAVGGAINFRTVRSYDGLEASARYGIGIEGYNAWDASITAGKAWTTGSVFGSFSYSYHDPIFGRDRDFIQEITWDPTSPLFGLGTERSCDPANVVIGGTAFFPLNAAGAPTGAALPNVCDRTDDMTFYSKDRRWSFFGGFSQEITDNLRLDVRGFMTKRTSHTSGGPFRAAGNVLPNITPPLPAPPFANPNYIPMPGAPADCFPAPGDPRGPACPAQSVRFSYQNVLPITDRNNILKTWQVTPTLTWDVGSGWQVRALATYGENDTSVLSDAIHTATQTARITSGLINPYDVESSGAGAFSGLTGLAQTRAHIQFQNYRLVADGPLFTLPGGEVRVAVGAEYYSIDYSRQQTDANFALLPSIGYKQNVKAAFAEIQIPIVGEGNRFAGIHALNVQASVRRDRYSDFGNTTNPSIGITLEPTDFLKFRGIWGTSFVAPSATAQLGQDVVGLQVLGNAVNLLQPPPGVDPTNPENGVGLFLNMGAVNDLKPQTSTNWSIGAEIRPPFIPGLSLSASLYDIKVKGILATPASGQLQTQFYPQFPTLWSVAPNQITGYTPAEIAAFISVATDASQVAYTAGPDAGRPVLFFADNRLRNLGNAHVRGIDFAVNYRRDIGFGTVDLSFVGNHELTSETQNGPGLPFNNLLLRDQAKWRWAAATGLTSGPFRGRLVWNHTAGFDVAEFGNNGQTRVKAFNTVDAFFSYDLGGMGIVENVQLTLNVNNVFNQDPPILKIAGTFLNFGYSPTVFTPGRFFQLGIRTKF